MSRLFTQHVVRNVISLDGDWTLHLPAKGTTLNPAKLTGTTRRPYTVPSVWETMHGLENYRGQAVAQKIFTTETPAPARLVFKGVSHTAEVYLDGKRVGRHYNAYTPFAIDLPSLPAGSHDLRVHISNEHSEKSTLHIPNDYYNYGGISRPAEIQLLQSSAYIRYIHFTPELRGSSWSGDLKICLINLSRPATANLHIELADASASLKDIKLPKGKTVVTARMKFKSIKPWSPTQPNLYFLSATLCANAQIIDDYRDRIGFRVVKTKGRDILLNNKPIKLVGFNRHEDHPDHGCALTVDAMQRDLDLFEDLGANAVRTSHYPNDERFLDLCDARGFLVWEEGHARGIGAGQMLNPLFQSQSLDVLDEMVNWHYNHPSIILWGILNECGSEDKQGRKIYQDQFNKITSIDASRLLTFASNRHERDICQDLVDVSSWNWYFGWYGTQPVEEGMNQKIKSINKSSARNKPVIISEFGAGAIPGFSDPRRKAKWSEERQAEMLEQYLSLYTANPRIMGLFIWQFCDVRVDEAYAHSRPRCMNNKGIVNQNRRPKLSYPVVKKYFTKVSKSK